MSRAHVHAASTRSIRNSRRYDDRTLGHADEADGIQEYDNRLPNWWLALLYGSIVFALFYTGQRHIWGDWSQAAAYEAELAAANERWPVRKAEALTAASAEQLAEGAAIYNSTCVACHGASMEGGIGARLNDDASGKSRVVNTTG